MLPSRHVYSETHYQRYDPKEAPSDRTKEPAKVSLTPTTNPPHVRYCLPSESAAETPPQ